jgi:hypothetical protein
MDGCPLWVLCALSGRGICDELITRPEESYRLWCVLVCDLGTSRMRRLKLIKGRKCQIEEECIDSTLSWKTHTQIKCSLSHSEISYTLCDTWNTEDGFFAYFHSITDYRLTFWRNSPHSTKTVKIQKNIIRITTGYRSKDSFRHLSKNLKILPLQSQYILSLLLLLANTKNKFKINSDDHHINTRQKCNFHQRPTNLSLYQRGVYSTISHTVSNI